MAPTNYQRGRAFEYRTRDKLLKLGAVYVMRAAQSKGAADLIALWPGYHPLPDWDIVASHPWLVQCKRDGKLPKAERQELLRIASETGASAVLARIPKSGRGVEFINLQTEEVM